MSFVNQGKFLENEFYKLSSFIFKNALRSAADGKPFGLGLGILLVK